MKLQKALLMAGAVAALGGSIAQADVTVYITGATAYRSAAISEIKNFLNLGFTGVYGTKSGVTSEGNAANVAIRGTTNKVAGVGVVTFKCCWAGSVGGVKLIQAGTPFNIDSQPGANGWIPDSVLTASGANPIAGLAEDNSVTPPTIGGTAFERGAGAAKPDAAFSDAFQSSAIPNGTGNAVGLGTDTANGKIGVIPFDWVVGNGVTPSTVTVFTGVTYGTASAIVNYTSTSGAAPTVGRTVGGLNIPIGTTITALGSGTITLSNTPTGANNTAPATITAADTTAAPINNITSNQARQIMVGGGALPMFTGNTSDAALAVYCYGRNADSGTRISVLGESGRGITQNPGNHIIPTFTGPAGTVGSGTGKGGLPSLAVSLLDLWPTEAVLGTTYTDGASGYNGGGDLAGALTAYGSTVSAVNTDNLNNAGYLIGYLGRNDSQTACATTFGQNTAKRLTFNGEQDWSGLGSANKVDGSPTAGYVDSNIRTGHYIGWEYEHFFRRASLGATADATKVLNQLASQILSIAAPPSGAILLSTMSVSKTVEGGAVFYP